MSVGTRRRPGGWEEPTLASAQIPEDVWEAGRLPLDPLPLTADRATAAALVADGGCSPQCLISAGPHGRDCSCRCRGAYHGILADADIASALARYKALNR
nr:hypothetical protein [Micromonospora sp. DSM 115978]